MRAPSLLAQCLPGLLPQDRGGVSSLSEKDLQLPTPAVEIIPSKVVCSFVDFIIVTIINNFVSKEVFRLVSYVLFLSKALFGLAMYFYLLHLISRKLLNLRQMKNFFQF